MARRIIVGVLICLGTAMAVQAAEFPQILGEPRPAGNQPWASQIREAEQLVNSAPEQARAHFELVLAEHPNSDGARRAIQGIADTYVVTRDYNQLTRFLENQMAQTRLPSISRTAQEVYSRVAATVDNAHMQAYQHHQAVQREYDDISWFNIFRIFDKFKLRGQLKDLKQDLDYISEVKMRFNPAHILPANQVAGGGAGNGYDDKGEDPLPLPGKEDLPVIGNGGGGSSMDLPDPGDLPEPGDLPDPGTTPGSMPPEFDGVRAGTDVSPGDGPGEGPNLDLDPAGTTLPSPAPAAEGTEEEGEEEVLGSSTAPAEQSKGEDEIDEKLRAVKLLKEELQQILALVPEDRRAHARELLVGNGGFAVLPVVEAQAEADSKGSATAGASGATGSAGSETAAATGATGSAGSTEPAAGGTGASGSSGSTETAAATGSTGTAGQTSGTASDTANSTGTTTTTVAGGEPVETTGSDTASSSTAASETASTSTPAAPDVATLKIEMETAYQQVLASMRQGSGTSLAATQQRYIDAMARYRAAASGQPVTSEPATRTAGSETASATDNTTSSTQASGTAGAGAQTLGGTPANGLGGIDPQQLNTGGPVKVNPGVGANGAPISDQGIRNIRSGFQ